MNRALWIAQVLVALVFGSAGIMKQSQAKGNMIEGSMVNWRFVV